MSQSPKIVMELPHSSQTEGGINRILRIAMELPHSSIMCGGIRDNLLLAERFEPQMHVRFQTLRLGYPQINLPWTVGYPDATFPECDICITFADNPNAEQLMHLPQIKKVYILMLSYGMSIKQERYNVHIPNINVLCSSKKIEKAIRAEGVNVTRIGIGLDIEPFYNEHKERKRYLAILYHDSEEKKYRLAVDIAEALFNSKQIEGIITFGRKEKYESAKKPKGLVRHYVDATQAEVREVFNQCKCFLMPSTTEGISLTPIESTLCGCPAIIVDGAINEVFFDNENCMVVKRNDRAEMSRLVVNIMNHYNTYAPAFENHMRRAVKDMTWENTINNLTKALWT